MIEQITALESARIGIIGDNKITDILLANIIGLGIQTICIFGTSEERRYTNKFFEKRHQKITIHKKDTIKDIEKYSLDFIINATTQKEERNLISATPTIYLRCTETAASISYDPTDPSENTLATGFFAAIAVDEARKHIARNNSLDKKIKNIVMYTLPKRKKRENFSIVVVGAGGLGNYYMLGASELNASVTLIDHDVFEDRNKHRQPFCIPGRKKAEVLSEYFPFIRPITQKFESAEFEKPDIIIGCVDNIATRKQIFEYSMKHTIPFLDGGVGETQGQIQLYNTVPEGKDTSKQTISCARVENPSIVIPNCVIGMQLATITPFAKDCAEYSFSFDTLMKNRIGEFYETR